MPQYNKPQARRAYSAILSKAGGLYLNPGGGHSYMTVEEVVAITKIVAKAARRNLGPGWAKGRR